MTIIFLKKFYLVPTPFTALRLRWSRSPITYYNTGLSSILILLDRSSAFDTVDHNVLFCHLKNYVGISDVALDWFISYLSNSSLSVRLGEASSSCAPHFCGVPLGSILGPLLFTFYMLLWFLDTHQQRCRRVVCS